jgi:polysaccharide export outer membrane protein
VVWAQPSTAVREAQPPPAAREDAGYIIGPRDVLSITVYGQADLTGRFTVEGDGTIAYSLIGRQKASGMSARAFENHLTKQLADGWLVNPRVSVSVESYVSQKVDVLGDVRSPGPYPLTGRKTALIEILAQAGATTTNEVTIVRPREPGRPTLPDDDNVAEVIRIDVQRMQAGLLGDNVELRHGDTIFVPKPGSAYVTGQVNSPGAIAASRDTTVLIALALAGGPNENAAMNRIDIVRVIDGKQTTLKGVKTSDLVLPGDTVMVNQRYF